MKQIKGISIIIILFFICDFTIEQIFKFGVQEMYGLNQKADILLIGHSHLMLATDKKQMEKDLGLKVSKYTREGVNVFDRKMMIQQFLDTEYADSLKIVLYGVDLCTFTGEGLSANSYKLFYPFIDNVKIGNYIYNEGGAKDYWLHKIVRTTRYSDDGIKNAAIRGLLHNWSNLKYGVINIEEYKLRLKNGDERHIQMNEILIEEFKETISTLTQRGIKVLLVNTPTLDLLNNFEPEKYQTIINWFQEYAETDSLIDFLDFNPQYSSCYDLFYDRLHLNTQGQKIISKEITSYLKQEYDQY